MDAVVGRAITRPPSTPHLSRYTTSLLLSLPLSRCVFQLS